MTLKPFTKLVEMIWSSKNIKIQEKACRTTESGACRTKESGKKKNIDELYHVQIVALY